MGPTLGPINGAAVTQYLSWHWIFYIMSMLATVVLVMSLFLLRETYMPVLQKRQQTAASSDMLAKPSMAQKLTALATTLAGKLKRPLRMLFAQPVIQLLALYVAYLYGVMYLVLSTFPTLWTVQYHQSIFIGGLDYIALGLGYIIGSQICALSLDRIYRHLKRRNGDLGLPEYRLPLALVSTVLVPVGLVVYAWSADYQSIWVVVDLGAGIFSAGAIIGMQCVTTYVVDAYSQYTASAIGAITQLRGLAGFALPLAGP